MKQCPIEKLQPLEDYVFILPYVSDGVTRGGIVLPDSAVRADQMGRGTVVAVGPGRIGKSGRLPVSIVKGDSVLFIEMEDEGVYIAGQRYIVMRDTDILAVLEN